MLGWSGIDVEYFTSQPWRKYIHMYMIRRDTFHAVLESFGTITWISNIIHAMSPRWIVVAIVDVSTIMM